MEIPPANKLSKEVDTCFQDSKKIRYVNILFNASNFSIVVLDEIDHLTSRNHAMLYSAFEWPYKSNGKAILIGEFLKKFRVWFII